MPIASKKEMIVPIAQERNFLSIYGKISNVGCNFLVEIYFFFSIPFEIIQNYLSLQ